MTTAAHQCQRGHPQTKRNTYIAPDGYTRCALCLAAAKLRYLTRNREQVRAYNREYQRKIRHKARDLAAMRNRGEL